ncbi:MAG: YdcF family protein [Pseudomonadota bacterium]
MVSTISMLRHHSANQDFPAKFDVILVLGGGIEPDGVLAYSTRRRVHTAVRLLKRGVTDRLIFTGGRLRPKRPITGEVMKEYAVGLGADPDAIAVETKSRTTWENFRYSYELITEADAQIGLLTDPTHLQRAMVLNTYLGGPEMVPIASLGQFKDRRINGIYEVSREALAWWFNLGKAFAWEGLGLTGMTEDERGAYIF